MINKCNYIYSIFNTDIIVSNKHVLNAIQGYEVIDKDEVLSRQDFIDWFRCNKKHMITIPKNIVWRFTNPVTGEQWYTTNCLLAYSSSSGTNRIAAFYDNGILIVPSLKTLIAYKDLFPSVTDIKIVYSIGSLSTPHRVVNNYSLNSDKIRLPYVV